MKDITTVSPGPAHSAVPDDAGIADGLHDRRVPVQVEELPQGVLDLLAALIVRTRSAGELGGLDGRLREQARSHRGSGSEVGDAGGLDGRIREQARAHGGSRSEVGDAGGLDGRIREQARAHRGSRSDVGDAGGLDGRIREQARSHGESHAHMGEQAQSHGASHASGGEQARFHRQAQSRVGASLLAKAAARAPDDLAGTVVADASMNLYGTRPAPVTPALALPLPPAPVPRSAIEPRIEPPPGPGPGLLQVPFNKGAASGQVTISREPDEPARPLLLSPSNPLVFEQLKVPFEQLREPGWRLADQRGEQQRQGSRQSPDEEPQESSTCAR